MSQRRTEVEGYANAVIGAAIEVHKELGPGFLEAVYEEALAYEMSLRKIPFEQQYPIAVSYKRHLVGQSRLDFLIGGSLIVELKAVEALNNVHQAQLISYFRATHFYLGLLINFNVTLMKNGIKRIIYTP
jgi:GxxExxY protein